MNCEHKNKKNLTSFKIDQFTNYILVKCLDCELERHETRNNKTGSIENSEWYINKKIKNEL